SAARSQKGTTFWKEAALAVPHLAALVASLIADKRVPGKVKATLTAVAAYLAMPFDLIPDFIPVLGYLDDLVLVILVFDGVKDQAVLGAMRRVPRHRFVPGLYAGQAYWDGPVPSGHGQMISQPYVVAFMTEALTLHSDDKVLEIGTGSGYQTAILAELARDVFSIEIVKPLADQAAEKLKELGYTNVQVRAGDGYQGWPQHAPYDAILVTAAPDHIPQPLLNQLARGGRLILPLGKKHSQSRVLIRRTQSGSEQTTLLPVAFVPM